MRESLGGVAVAAALISTSAHSGEVKIDDLITATTIPSAQQEATIIAAKAFYQFWNTGDEGSLTAAIAPSFTPL